MQLLFKTRSAEYTGSGSLPNGSFDDTSAWQPMTKYLEDGAVNYPDKPMFKIADTEGIVVETYSYKETNDKANQVANGLIGKIGVKKGDKVGMYMLNCAEFVLSILAIHKTGGVQVPINKDEKGERLAYVINYSEMIGLVVDPSGLPLIQEIADQLENLKIIYVTGEPSEVPDKIGDIAAEPFNNLYEFSTDNPNVDVKISDKERCMFTSGTTGKPKGVVREHGGVVLTVRAYLQQQGIRNDDIMMSVLSLGHANAQAMCLFTSIGAGATAVFFPRFSASNFFKWAHNCGATCVNMLGAVAEYLFSSKPSEYDQKHNIRIMLGSPAPRNLIDFQERFNVRVIDGYGSTEMGMVLWKNPEDNRDKSMGYPTEGFYVELRNPENIEEVIRPHWDPYTDADPPDSAKGILYIRPLIANTTLNEYFKDERRTIEAFDDDGFFNSDDVMACGTDGRYYFVGRHTRLRVSGENVDPIAVQDYALEYPAIQDAIAVGLRLPDVSDDELKLNIILKDGEKYDHAEFCTWMAEKVIIAMVPRFIEIFEGGFPVTATQKIKVAELKEITDKTWDRSKAGLKFSARK